MGLFDWAQGAGTPPCPAGSKFCSGQSKTEVGKKNPVRWEAVQEQEFIMQLLQQ